MPTPCSSGWLETESLSGNSLTTLSCSGVVFAGDVFAGEDHTDRLIEFGGVSLDERRGDGAGRLDHEPLQLEQLSQGGANVGFRDKRNRNSLFRNACLHRRMGCLQ